MPKLHVDDVVDILVRIRNGDTTGHLRAQVTGATITLPELMLNPKTGKLIPDVVKQFSIVGKYTPGVYLPETDAERLALAVLTGDRTAAYLLADEVLLSRQ